MGRSRPWEDEGQRGGKGVAGASPEEGRESQACVGTGRGGGCAASLWGESPCHRAHLECGRRPRDSPGMWLYHLPFQRRPRLREGETGRSVGRPISSPARREPTWGARPTTAGQACVWLSRSLATGRRNVPIEKNFPRHCPKHRARGPLGSCLPLGQRTQRPGTDPPMALD